MEVFRLSREKYDPLSGKGAAIKGARWNSIGVELIYTAMNRSLAMAEVAVHFTWATLPDDYVMVTVNIPDDLEVPRIVESDLPVEWTSFPHHISTQRYGDSFVSEEQYVALRVPSVVTQGYFNILINPNHKDFKKIKITKIEKFPFDRRILK